MYRIAPIFAVHNLEASLGYYQLLGFTVRTYVGGGYGYALAAEWRAAGG